MRCSNELHFSFLLDLFKYFVVSGNGINQSISVNRNQLTSGIEEVIFLGWCVLKAMHILERAVIAEAWATLADARGSDSSYLMLRVIRLDEPRFRFFWQLLLGFYLQ